MFLLACLLAMSRRRLHEQTGTHAGVLRKTADDVKARREEQGSQRIDHIRPPSSASSATAQFDSTSARV
jgi:hypothetical protein